MHKTKIIEELDEIICNFRSQSTAFGTAGSFATSPGSEVLKCVASHFMIATHQLEDLSLDIQAILDSRNDKVSEKVSK